VTLKRVAKLASNSNASVAKVASQDQDLKRPAPAHKQKANALLEKSTAEWILGSDEAGYGTLAGSLVVVAMAVRRSWGDPEVTDSKVLSDTKRRSIVRRYRGAEDVFRVVHTTSPRGIDEVGVWTSLINAHNQVHEALEAKLRAVDPWGELLHIVDGLENARRRLDARFTPLSSADLYVPAVSLASCFAKVVQCELMDLAAKSYPGYGFERHRGYDTPQHREALARLGVTPIHRKSYRTIRDLLSADGFSADRG
jgi:ribonuclease HII